jgi:hypothetical protein
MARIRRQRLPERTRVTITGRLTAADMGRLEHACAEALTSGAVALDLDLSGVTDADRTAAAIVRRIEHRGARIRYPLGGHPTGRAGR